MKISHTEYLPKGKLERFNKNSVFLRNVREVIREAHILKDKDEYSYEKLKKIFPQAKWTYNPFEKIRMTLLLSPQDYVVIQDILEEQTGQLWEFDKFMLVLIQRFIREYKDKQRRENKRILKRFEHRFKKYYGNIMGSWKE